MLWFRLVFAESLLKYLVIRELCYNFYPMKLLVVCTLWFAFIITSSPIPGQTPEHPADAKSNVQSDSTQEKKPAPTPPVVNPSKSKTDEGGTQTPSGQDKPRSVRITELPPLPRGQLWMDRIAWGASILLVVIAGIGVCLANRTLKVMETTLVSTFRPKLVIRMVVLHPGQIIPVAQLGVNALTVEADHRPWKIQYFVVNVGGTDAVAIEISAKIQYFQKGILPQIPPYDPARQPIDQSPIVSGDERETWLELASEDDNRSRFISAFQNRTEHWLYFLGFIKYRDKSGRARKTGFCRRFDITTKRFIPVSDPDYEYTDYEHQPMIRPD